MEKFEKIFIFFDTNVLETRFSGKKIFLSEIKISNKYYEVENLIKSMDLLKDINLCIPEIVWKELLEHMYQSYISEKQSMTNKIEDYKKQFGDLIDIHIDYKEINNEVRYLELLNTLSDDFVENSRIIAKIIPYPKDERTVVNLIDKAMKAISPFSKAKGNSKEYTDAGFKDALILETMVLETKGNMCILITNDNDFRQAFKNLGMENFQCVYDIDELKKIIVNNFDIIDSEYMELDFRNNEYMLSRILNEAGFDEIKNVKFEKIKNIKEAEIGKMIILSLRVNGDKCDFEIEYDFGAKELISSQYIEIEEEDDAAK